MESTTGHTFIDKLGIQAKHFYFKSTYLPFHKAVFPPTFPNIPRNMDDTSSESGESIILDGSKEADAALDASEE